MWKPTKTTRLRLEALEDRTVPSSGTGVLTTSSPPAFHAAPVLDDGSDSTVLHAPVAGNSALQSNSLSTHQAGNRVESDDGVLGSTSQQELRPAAGRFD
jgi:hypothetical protein